MRYDEMSREERQQELETLKKEYKKMQALDLNLT